MEDQAASLIKKSQESSCTPSTPQEAAETAKRQKKKKKPRKSTRSSDALPVTLEQDSSPFQITSPQPSRAPTPIPAALYTLDNEKQVQSEEEQSPDPSERRTPQLEEEEEVYLTKDEEVKLNEENVTDDGIARKILELRELLIQWKDESTLKVAAEASNSTFDAKRFYRTIRENRRLEEENKRLNIENYELLLKVKRLEQDKEQISEEMDRLQDDLDRLTQDNERMWMTINNYLVQSVWKKQ